MGLQVDPKELKKRQFFLEGNIPKAVLSVCLPMALFQLINELFRVFDLVITSQINPESVSAVSFFNQLNNSIVSVGTGLSIGAGILIAGLYGAGEYERLKTTVNTTFFMAGAAALVLVAGLILGARPILRLANTPAQLVEIGLNYYRITALNLFFTFFNNVYIAIEKARAPAQGCDPAGLRHGAPQQGFLDCLCKTLFWERKGMKKFLKNWFTDNRKAGLMRWWLAGMCYFMIGFGTQVGGYSSPIDFIFFLGVGIGLVTIVVYNPIAYNVFRLTRNGEILNHTYRNISGAKKAARNLVEIAASMITVILVYLTYQNLNLLLNQMLELPVETVLIPGEPFGFATLYLLFYTVLSELAAKLRDRKEKRGKRVK